jgi:hypothetical protein
MQMPMAEREAENAAPTFSNGEVQQISRLSRATLSHWRTSGWLRVGSLTFPEVRRGTQSEWSAEQVFGLTIVAMLVRAGLHPKKAGPFGGMILEAFDYANGREFGSLTHAYIPSETSKGKEGIAYGTGGDPEPSDPDDKWLQWITIDLDALMKDIIRRHRYIRLTRNTPEPPE